LSKRFAEFWPDLERVLTRGADTPIPKPLFAVPEIGRETVWVSMRDGVRLATDLYLCYNLRFSIP
jgi:predicted acyl esterase